MNTLAAVAIVLMYIVSGIAKLFAPFRCDKNYLSTLLGKPPCHPAVSGGLVMAGLVELTGAISVVISYTSTSTDDKVRETQRKTGATLLIAFTILVTVLFKLPPIYRNIRSDTLSMQQLIPLLANITATGALLAIHADVP